MTDEVGGPGRPDRRALGERGRPGPAVALGVVASAPRDAGAVPRRVAALLAPPPVAGRWAVAVGAGKAFLSVVAAAERVRDLGYLPALWSTI
ncbi:hypothetical protein WHI96_26035 [Pseudonocardia tropica]|uniref:DUF4147 domain-containing protein n=1 Tax=Pseudonocardia tropica TaxID=681289 RepID=A0ABV1K3Z1_9PSEU